MLALCFSVNAEITKWPGVELPILVFNESDTCQEPQKGIYSAKLSIKGSAYYLEFPITVTGGRILVNPQVTEGYESLTVSVETTHKTNLFTGCFCVKHIKAAIKAKINKYKKIYVVVDSTVLYDINIPNK